MGGRETQARSPQSARSRAEGKETSRKGEGADEGSRKGGQGREEGKGDPDFTPRLPLHPVRPSCPCLGAALGAQRPTSLCSSPPHSLHGTRHSLPLTISFTSHLVTCLAPRIPSRLPRRQGLGVLLARVRHGAQPRASTSSHLRRHPANSCPQTGPAPEGRSRGWRVRGARGSPEPVLPTTPTTSWPRIVRLRPRRTQGVFSLYFI